MSTENDKIKEEMNPVIEELKKQGISIDCHTRDPDLTGLGDVVEGVLQSFGVTEERFKQWFNLKECNCKERKKWLNNLLSWKKSQA